MGENEYFCKNERRVNFLYKIHGLSQKLCMAISIDDIKGPNCLETWLRERPEGVRQNGAVFIAARSALRVLPIAVDTCQFGQRAIERGVTAVPALLGLLIASVSTKDLTMDLAEKAESMSQSHWDIFSISSVEHAYAAWITALSAAYIHVFGGQKDEEGEPGVLLAPISADSNAYAWSNAIIEKFEASRAAIDQDVSGDDRTAARNTVDTTLALADASQRVCWDFVREDCRLWLANAADDGTCAIDVAPLRIDAVGVDPDWPTLREKLLNDGDPDRGADWSFWVDWYNKILGGDPQDWDMLHEIAVSDGIDWQASPRAVTAAIARIVQKHRLLNEIGDLKSHLDQFRASAEVRSHNMPPELLEDLVEET